MLVGNAHLTFLCIHIMSVCMYIQQDLKTALPILPQIPISCWSRLVLGYFARGRVFVIPHKMLLEEKNLGANHQPNLRTKPLDSCFLSHSPLSFFLATLLCNSKYSLVIRTSVRGKVSFLCCIFIYSSIKRQSVCLSIWLSVSNDIIVC